MNYDCSAFDSSVLSFDVSEYKWMTFPNYHRLFDLLLSYVASHLVDDCGSGYRCDVTRSKVDDENPIGATQFGRIIVKISYGQYKFRLLGNGEECYALYQHLGKPVGADCGPDVMQNLIIFTKSIEKFATFLSDLINLSEKPEEGQFVCFTWSARQQYWREDVRVNNRPMESVVLPEASKKRLLTDVEKFLSARTKDFYHRNGIPYRRSYLFHGVPGTGKTSMVQALAGHFKRNVCFLMPTHPEMTDDGLREAIQQIPENSIVVFEDIDTLFTKDRINKVKNSSVTFSGLLNALDGIGSPNGQIFVLTTNLREQLDAALIRNGRVDLHIEFTYSTKEQMEEMWKNFYPQSRDLAGDFSTAVTELLKTRGLHITTSSLQHFFITQMDATAEEALKEVHIIVDEILQNNSKSMLAAASATSGTSEKKRRKRNNNKKGNKSDNESNKDEEERSEEDVESPKEREKKDAENEKRKEKKVKREKRHNERKERKERKEKASSENESAKEQNDEGNQKSENNEDFISIDKDGNEESNKEKRSPRNRRDRKKGNGRKDIPTEVVYKKKASDATEAASSEKKEEKTKVEKKEKRRNSKGEEKKEREEKLAGNEIGELATKISNLDVVHEKSTETEDNNPKEKKRERRGYRNNRGRNGDGDGEGETAKDGDAPAAGEKEKEEKVVDQEPIETLKQDE